MKNTHYAFLGTRLKTERKKKNITQEKLAELVGCSSAHISHIETGNTIPSLNTIISIINHLHISSDALLCDYVDKTDVYLNEWSDLLQNCTDKEIKFIVGISKEVLQNLRKLID